LCAGSAVACGMLFRLQRRSFGGVPDVPRLLLRPVVASGMVWMTLALLPGVDLIPLLAIVGAVYLGVLFFWRGLTPGQVKIAVSVWMSPAPAVSVEAGEDV
jgi:hypothetical protein